MKITHETMKKKMMLKDIAIQLNVSPSAVSLVLKNKKGVSAETRARIQKVLIEQGYSIEQPTEASISVPTQTQQNICFLKYKNSAVLVEENGNFVSSIIDSVNEECQKLGFNLLITTFGPENKKDTFLSAQQALPEGIIVLGTELTESDMSIIENLQTPLVLVDSTGFNRNINCVTMDNQSLIRNAVANLYQHGHRSIGYLHSSLKTGNFCARFDGYRNALYDLNLPFSPDYMFSIQPSLSGAFADMEQILSENHKLPTAFVSDNDMIALGCMRSLTSHGYILPRDISLIGVDDIPFSAISVPKLSSMHVSCKDIGIHTVRLLKQLMQEPTSTVTKIQVGGYLVERDSVSFPRY